jgi:hypothetical protein
MAKPTEIVTWATDATYTVDGDAWGGDSTKVDPGATRRAEGAEPDVFPAEWLNYHLNALGLHNAYVHGVFEETESIPAATKTLVISAASFTPDRVSGSDNWRSTGQSGLISNATNAPNWILFSTNTALPPGSIITRVRAIVTPGAVRATEADRMFIEIRRMDFAFDAGPPTEAGTAVFAPSGATGRDDGTTATQTISTGAVSITLDDQGTEDHEVRIYNGSTAGNDAVLAVEIQYTNPGPRSLGAL